MKLVLKEAELNDSWGLPSTPTYKSVETVIFGKILTNNNMLDNATARALVDYGIMKLEDPVYYILNFSEGGYAVVSSNKKLGAEIIQVQNYDNEPNYATIADDADPYEGFDYMGYDSMDDFLDAKRLDWLLGRGSDIVEDYNELSMNPNYSGVEGPLYSINYSEWAPVVTSEANVTFYPEAENFDMPGRESLGKCWQVLFSFLGYWEAPSTLIWTYRRLACHKKQY